MIFLYGCQSQHLYKDTQAMMGTFVEVVSPDRRAPQIVFSEIRRLEKLLSKYDPASEVARLNQSGRMSVSPETFFMIKKSLEFCQISDGAFDITVSSLLDLWGFTNKNYVVPKEEQVKNTLSLVGSDKIILQNTNNMVEFTVLGMKIDLGAIAKGFALDCAADKLRKNRINSCLINCGGQVYCLGDKFGEPWKVAIKDPRGKDVIGYLELKDKSVATSGDYEQYFIRKGRRYAHIFNPRTGYPADSGIISVTVIAPDGLTADALATAVFILGKSRGEALVKRFPGVQVRIIEK